MKEDKDPKEEEELPKTPEKSEAEELKETLQRLQAEFENYRKRTEKEKLEFCKYAARDIIMEILPVFDNLELALKNSKDKIEFEKGIMLVHSQFKKALNDMGVSEINALGERFDPRLHEALMKESGSEASHVTEEFQKGYMLHDRVLKHSKVKVGVKDDREKEPKGKDTKKGEELQ